MSMMMMMRESTCSALLMQVGSSGITGNMYSSG